MKHILANSTDLSKLDKLQEQVYVNDSGVLCEKQLPFIIFGSTEMASVDFIKKSRNYVESRINSLGFSSQVFTFVWFFNLGHKQSTYVFANSSNSNINFFWRHCIKNWMKNE